jgi:hypothetical protein
MCLPAEDIPLFMYFCMCTPIAGSVYNSITGVDIMDTATTVFAMILLMCLYVVAMYLHKLESP